MDEKVITVSDSALSFLRESQREAGAVGVRVDIVSGGCQGMMYALDFVTEESAADPTDLVLSDGNLRIYISPKARVFIGGMRMDYVKSPMGGHIVFENPNAKVNCSCGKSFCIDEGSGEPICKTCQ
ncbi:MAG: iron-sulfur cluster assembly accessory protein [Holosporaceae bacterium]|jgi:iron-sulfur cluster assembly accessory protein|nr:iron-sulfur cluster assembly accessory protein [Holosporaceae bacterium]